MVGCPFYKYCPISKNPYFCESTENLLLCKTHNKLKKQMEIKKRAKEISDRQKLKKGKIRL